MNKKIKYLLQLLNKNGFEWAYFKSQIFNAEYDYVRVTYMLKFWEYFENVDKNDIQEFIKEGFPHKKGYWKMVSIKDHKSFESLKGTGKYLAFNSETTLLLFMIEYCDRNGIDY